VPPEPLVRGPRATRGSTLDPASGHKTAATRLTENDTTIILGCRL